MTVPRPTKNSSVGAVLKSGAAAGGRLSGADRYRKESETEGTTAETAEETFNVTVTFWYRENLMVNVGRVTVRGASFVERHHTQHRTEQNLNLDAVIDQDMTLSADSVTLYHGDGRADYCLQNGVQKHRFAARKGRAVSLRTE